MERTSIALDETTRDRPHTPVTVHSGAVAGDRPVHRTVAVGIMLLTFPVLPLRSV